MSRIGQQPPPATTAPLTTAQSTGTINTTGPSGILGGNTVQQAATPQVRAQSGDIGASIAKFFTNTLPNAFSSAIDTVLSLFKARDAAPAPQTNASTAPAAPATTQTAVPLTPKPIDAFTFPGDYFASENDPKKFLFPPKNEAEASVYATVKHHSDNTSNAELNSFMRLSNLSTNKVAVAEGAPLAADVRNAVRAAYIGQGLLAFREASYDTSMSNYSDIRDKSDHGVNADIAARQAVQTAEGIYAQIFGTSGDQNSINAAAAKVPQGLCDALAIAMKAIDDSGGSDDLKANLKTKLQGDMIALRVVNPAVTSATTPKPGEAPLTNTERNNVMEFTKFAQNIANNIPMSGNKERIHTAASQELASRGTEANLQATFKSFCAAVLARADSNTVAAAVTAGTQMKTDFDAAQDAKKTAAAD